MGSLYRDRVCTLSWALHSGHCCYSTFSVRGLRLCGGRKQVRKWPKEHPKRNKELGSSWLIHQLGVHPQRDWRRCPPRNSAYSDHRAPPWRLAVRVLLEPDRPDFKSMCSHWLAGDTERASEPGLLHLSKWGARASHARLLGDWMKCLCEVPGPSRSPRMARGPTQAEGQEPPSELWSRDLPQPRPPAHPACGGSSTAERAVLIGKTVSFPASFPWGKTMPRRLPWGSSLSQLQKNFHALLSSTGVQTNRKRNPPCTRCCAQDFTKFSFRIKWLEGHEP